MGLLNLLGASKAKPTLRPIQRELRFPIDFATEISPPLHETLRRLFEAAALADDDSTRRLLREHGRTLRARAAEWMPPPPALKTNPAALRWRQRGVERLIWRCADQFGQAGWLTEWERLKGDNR